MLKLIGIAFALVLGISFSLLNSVPVEVDYYLGRQAMPLSLLILFVLVIGMIMGGVSSLPTILKLKLELRRLRERS